jgi:hypothetical protein
MSCFVSTQRYGLSAGAGLLLSKTRASSAYRARNSHAAGERVAHRLASPQKVLRVAGTSAQRRIREMRDARRLQDDDLIAQVHGSVARGMEIPTCTTSAWHSPPGKQTLQTLVCDTGVLRQPCLETAVS